MEGDRASEAQEGACKGQDSVQSHTKRGWRDLAKQWGEDRPKGILQVAPQGTRD